MAKEYHYIPCKTSRRNIMTGSVQHANGLKVTLNASKTMTTKELCEQISDSSSLTPGDMVNAIDCLKQVLGNALITGQSVTLDGIGTFSISIGTTEPKMVGETIKSKDICVKGINFRPSKELMQKMATAKFTVTHDLGERLSDEATLAKVREYMTSEASGGLISIRKYAELGKCHYSTARMKVKGLVEHRVLQPCPYVRYCYMAGEAFHPSVPEV